MGAGLKRVSEILDLIREKANIDARAEAVTENNFPSGAGIASSASAFAALAVGRKRRRGTQLSERELSRLARRGSGSASRSIPEGFVEWQAGTNDEDSFAFSIAPPNHWDLHFNMHQNTIAVKRDEVAYTSPSTALNQKVSEKVQASEPTIPAVNTAYVEANLARLLFCYIVLKIKG